MRKRDSITPQLWHTQDSLRMDSSCHTTAQGDAYDLRLQGMLTWHNISASWEGCWWSSEEPVLRCSEHECLEDFAMCLFCDESLNNHVRMRLLKSEKTMSEMIVSAGVDDAIVLFGPPFLIPCQAQHTVGSPR